MTAAAALVFDLDGTLIDSRLDIAAAANHMLRSHDRPELPPDTIATFVGDGARLLVARCADLPTESPDLDPWLETFLSYYTAHAATHTTLMPGAASALTTLASFPLCICTNKPRQTTDAVLAELGLTQKFAVVVAGGDLQERKPDPAPLRLIARRLELTPSALVMVGDGPQDIECGRAAGARTVGVKGGLLPLSRLVASEPDALLDSLDELPPVIRRWAGSE